MASCSMTGLSVCLLLMSSRIVSSATLPHAGESRQRNSRLRRTTPCGSSGTCVMSTVTGGRRLAGMRSAALHARYSVSKADSSADRYNCAASTLLSCCASVVARS